MMVPNGVSVDAAEGFAIPNTATDAQRRPFADGKILLAAAAPKEAGAAASWCWRAGAAPPAHEPADPAEQWRWRLTPVNERFDLVLTGVGKVNAAAGVLAVLDPGRHGAVLNVGVAGALPGSGLEVGQVIAATASVYADEGLEADAGFRTIDEMGFPLGPFSGGVVPADPVLLEWLATVADVRGGVATLSTCSGTDARAAAVRERTGAVAEAMEGAAIGHALMRQFSGSAPSIPFAELRVISNRTGRREAQGWNLNLALERLGDAIARLAANLR